MNCVIHYGDLFGTPANLVEGKVIIRKYQEIASQVIMCLNVELELALVAIKIVGA